MEWVSSYNNVFMIVDFAEKLYKKLESSRGKFDVRVMMMNLISQLIGTHKVMLEYIIIFM